MGSAAITDLVAPSQLGKANARMFSYIGVAIFGAPLVASQRLLALTYYAPPSECWRYEKGANGEKNTDPPCAPKTDAVPYLWDWWAQQNAETDPLQTKTDPSDPQKRLPPDSRPTDAGTPPHTQGSGSH